MAQKRPGLIPLSATDGQERIFPASNKSYKLSWGNKFKSSGECSLINLRNGQVVLQSRKDAKSNIEFIIPLEMDRSHICAIFDDSIPTGEKEQQWYFVVWALKKEDGKPEKMIFKAGSSEERKAWVYAISTAYNRPSSKLLVLTSPAPPVDLSRWQAWMEESVLLPLQPDESHVPAAPNRQGLAAAILALTAPDPFSVSLRKLTSLQLSIQEKTSNDYKHIASLLDPSKGLKRPHEYIDHNSKNPAEGLEKIISNLRDLENQTQKTSTKLSKIIVDFLWMYITELMHQGARSPPILLQCASRESFSSRIIHPFIYNKIMEKETSNFHALHFRIQPKDTLNLTAYQTLTEKIWDERATAPTSVIAKVTNLNNYSKTTFVEISLTENGVPLSTLLEKAPELYSLIDPYSLSLHFMATTLIPPSSIKPSDIHVICVDLPESKKKRLELSNCSLSPAFALPFETVQRNLQVNIKNSFWLLPQTRGLKLHPEAVHKLISCHPMDVSLKVVMELLNQNQMIDKLSDKGSPVSAHLKPKDGKRLCSAVELAQKLLKNGTILYEEYLFGMYPATLSHLYEAAYKEIPSEPSEYHNLSAIISISSDKLKSRETAPTSETSSPKLQNVLANILKNSSWQQIPTDTQGTLLSELTKLSTITKIEIRGSSELDLSHIEEFLGNQTSLLECLILEDCSRLSPEDIEKLKTNSKVDNRPVESLRIEFINCVGLRGEVQEIRVGRGLLLKFIHDSSSGGNNSKELLTNFHNELDLIPALAKSSRILKTLKQFQPAAGNKEAFPKAVDQLIKLFTKKENADDGLQVVVQLLDKFDFPKIAIEEGSIDFLKFLHSTLESQFVNTRRTVSSLFDLALKFKYIDIAEYLVEECEAAFEVDWSTFYKVVQAKHWALAELLLYHNNALADSQGCDPTKNNALGMMCALPNIEPKFFEYFVNLNPCIHRVTNSNGLTALHLAATGSPASVKLLIELGADINIKNAQRNDPVLHLLSRDLEKNPPKPETIALFLAAGWRPKLANEPGNLMEKVKEENLLALKWMVDPAGCAAALGEAVPAMPALNIDLLSCRNPDKQTLIHIIPTQNSEKYAQFVEYLCAKDQRFVKECDFEGRTALFALLDQPLQGKYEEIKQLAQILTSQKFDINHRDSDGYTILEKKLKEEVDSLQKAGRASSLKADITYLIEELSADPTTIGKTTPLILAAQTMNPEIIHYIEQQATTLLQKTDPKTKFKDTAYYKKDADGQTYEQLLKQDGLAKKVEKLSKK